jgi:hypothetical protein
MNVYLDIGAYTLISMDNRWGAGGGSEIMTAGAICLIVMHLTRVWGLPAASTGTGQTLARPIKVHML